MMRATPKRKTVHRDPFYARSLNELCRINGLDLLDRNAVYQLPGAERDVRTPSGRGLRKPLKRRLTDAEVAERSHYAALAAKYEAARERVAVAS